MAIEAQLADGRILEFPDGTDPSVIQATVKRIVAQSAPPKESTIGSELVRGGKQVLSSARTGLESIFSPNEAAKAGVARSEDIGKEAGESVSLEAVKKAYRDKGLLSAAGETVSQIPRALAGQGANLASMYAGAKAGSAAGSAFGIPGRAVGAALGTGAVLLPQFAGSNVERQAEEQMEAGKNVDINRTKAYSAAAFQAALEGGGTALTLGKRVVGGILGITEDAALKSVAAQAELVKAAERSLAASAGRGVVRGAAEMPVEVAQQVLERYQAGLELTSPDAYKEYGESAYQAALIGGPLGGAAGVAGRGQARSQLDQQRRAEEAARPREPKEETVPGAKLPETARVGTQGTLFTPQEMGKKVAQPKQEAAPVAETFPELTARREQLRAQEQTPEVRAELDNIAKRLAPQSKGQLDLGLDFQREYTDLYKERDRLREGPQTPEVKARIAEVSGQLASYDEADIGRRQAEKIIKEQRLTEEAEKKAADEAGAQRFPGLAGATTAPITQADIDAIGLPLKTSKQWITDNVLGKTVEEIKALVQRDPKLVSGTGARAGVLKALISPQPAVFEEKPNEPTITKTDKPQGELDLGGGESGVGVSGKPTGTDVVQPGAGVPATTGTSETPNGLGLAPAGQPAGTGITSKGTQPPAVITTPTRTSIQVQDEIRAIQKKQQSLLTKAGRVPAIKSPARKKWDELENLFAQKMAERDTLDKAERAVKGTNATTTTSAAPSAAAPATTTKGSKKATGAATKTTTTKETQAPAPAVATETVDEEAARKAEAEDFKRRLDAVERKQKEAPKTQVSQPAKVTPTAKPAAREKAAADTRSAFDISGPSIFGEDIKAETEMARKGRTTGLKSVAIAEGQTLEALKEEVKNAKGVLGTALRRMVASGKVVLEDAHPSGKKIGGFYNGETVTLYANGIPSGQSMAVALHEVGAHLGMEKLLGKKQYNAVIDRILDMVAKGDGSTEAKMAQTAYKRIPVSDLERGAGRDEMVAYFVEEMAKSEAVGTLPKIGPMRVMWNQIKTAIITSINKALGTNFGVKDFSAQDILDIAKSSFVAESETAPTKGKEVDMASTSQFQNWFGDSKVVDKDGKPLRVYHGTLADFDTFKVSPEGALGAGIYTTPSAEFANTYADTNNLSRPEAGMYEVSGQRVMPVYVSMQNPLVLNNERGDPMIAALVKLGMAKDKAETLVEKAYDEHGYVRKQVMTRAMAQGYDGIMQYKQGELSEVVAFRPTQIKSAIGNRGTYDVKNPKILFSVNPSTEALIDSMGPLDRNAKSGLPKLIAGVKANPDIDYVTKFRTQVTDIAATIEKRLRAKFDGAVRNSLGELNPMGLYRQAQDYTKMLLEYFQTGTLYKDKTTGLWKSGVGEGVRPPAEVYELIDKYGEKNGYSRERATQIASRILEAVRLDEMRRSNNTGMTNFAIHLKDNEIDQLVKAYNADPDLQEMSKLMDEARKAMVDNLVAVGRLSAEEGKLWRKVVGYVPFDRETIDSVAANFNKAKKISGKGLAQLGKLPELVGSLERPVGNVFDNYLNTLGWMVGQTLKADATLITLRSLEDIGQAKKLRTGLAPTANSVGAYVNGEMQYWELPSKYDVMAFKDLNPPKAGWIRAMGAFSNILRKTVTVLPPFALKQVMDDVQRAILTSGVKNPGALVWMSLTNFPKLALAELRGIQHPMVKDFGRLGLTGEYDFEAGKPAASLLKDLGYKERTVLGSSKLGALIHKLDGITRASDLAVRKAIYDQTMKESNDALLAQTRAREFINFRRRGANQFVTDMITVIPFFNAYIQGMDVLYRAASGKDSSSSVDRAQARRLFYSRAITVTMLSSLYALGKDDDDEDYKEMDLRTRDSNWILGGGYKIGVPGELGAIFKVIPERIVEYMRRQGTPEEQTAFEAVRTTLSYMFEQYLGRAMPVPQAIKPVIEAWANKSFLTGKDLEGYHHKAMDPSMRMTEQTSELAKTIVKFSRDEIGVEVSPIMVDNALRGYFGSSAAMLTMVTDSLLNPTRVDRPLHKYALLSNYLYDPVGTRRMTEFYEEREKVGKANTTLNELMKTDLDRAEKYVDEHADELQLEGAVNSTLEQLERTRAYRKFLNSPDGAKEMSKEDRETELKELKKMEIELVGWVREAKAELRKVQR